MDTRPRRVVVLGLGHASAAGRLPDPARLETAPSLSNEGAIHPKPTRPGRGPANGRNGRDWLGPASFALLGGGLVLGILVLVSVWRTDKTTVVTPAGSVQK